jgi:hydroxyproline O-galactosyltransferase 2/3/4/5/6
MKCDDDTFVRVDVMLKEISITGQNKPIYMGNLNLLHRPLRHGKWAVTYEVTLSLSDFILQFLVSLILLDL